MGIINKHVNADAKPRIQRIPDAFVDELNAKADILSVIEPRVKLRKSGASNWLGLCPFHTEKGPSFTVTPSKGMYHCFGCGASGTALTFLIQHDGLPFREAVVELATMSGMALPAQLQDGTETSTYQECGPLYACTEAAAQFFRHVLAYDPTGRAYLRERGISSAIANRYLIGYAPDEWRSLEEVFPDYQTNQTIVQAGLVREKPNDSSQARPNRYDTFRARVIFPVRDTRGRICAFGGRIVGPTTSKTPKYLNSPESPIFDKSSTLYGLYEARETIRLKKYAIVVEGYIDVLMLAQHGLSNAVACMGTSLTRTHVEKLLTQTTMVVFAFDGDPAGRKAAWNALNTCMPVLQDQHDLRFLILPQGKDPDDLAKEEGLHALEERIRTAPSLSEFLIGELRITHNNLATAEDRARFAASGFAIAALLSYTTRLRRILLKRIADESQTPGSVIRTLHAASKNRIGRLDLWAVLRSAAQVAVSEALQQRDAILPLLDTEDANEAAFAATLQSITPEQATQAIPSDPKYLVSRDVMLNAIEMITEHRQAQVQALAKAQLQNGTLDEAEYLRLTLRNSTAQ